MSSFACINSDSAFAWFDRNYMHLVKYGEHISGNEMAERIEKTYGLEDAKHKYAYTFAKRTFGFSRKKSRKRRKEVSVC